MINFLILTLTIHSVCVQSILLNQDLSKGWEFKEVNNETWLPAKVPGTVHLDLIDNKIIEDPFYRDNEKKVRWIEYLDWEYQTTFDVNPEVFNKNFINLTFEGLDTHAKVYLNSNMVLLADNMFRKWSVSIKDKLKPNNNKLHIVFASAVQHDDNRNNSINLPCENTRPWSRKAQYHYGWDWGPRLVTSGIWQPLYLIGYDFAIIEDFNIQYTLDHNWEAYVTFAIELQIKHEKNYKISVYDEKNSHKEIKLLEKTLSSGHQVIKLEYNFKPEIWWPNGYGQQNLYKFKVELSSDNTVIDSSLKTVGFRTVELIQDRDLTGMSFFLRVNGIDMFMKGANYIPPKSFMPSMTKEDYDEILNSCHRTHFNMLRVWGGGNYENDYFYERCDELGILIWQDFMYAGCAYPGDAHFTSNALFEAVYQVKRLRTHPSIAMWCGNNEVYEMWFDWKLFYMPHNKDEIWSWNINLFENVLGGVIREHDPTRFYWKTSPSYGWGKDISRSEGDNHYWGYWHGKSKFETSNMYRGRFISEYGMQAAPDLSSFEKFAIEEDLNVSSVVMGVHQKHLTGFRNLQTYFRFYARLSQSFTEYVYITQMIQAMGIQMVVEAYRRNYPITMGSLFWQINDVWPVFSWSSIDYYGNWKALQYRLVKYYSDVIVSANTSEHNSIEIYTVSDRRDSFIGKIDIKLCLQNGTVLWSDSFPALVPTGSYKQYFVDFNQTYPHFNHNETFLYIELWYDFLDESKGSFEHFYYFLAPKFRCIDKPNFEVKIEETGIHISSDILAYFVELRTKPHKKNVFKDNYFDLFPNKTRFIPTLEKVENVQVYSFENVPVLEEGVYVNGTRIDKIWNLAGN